MEKSLLEIDPCPNLTCTFKNGQTAFSTKSVKHGRWYYEITHVEGDFMFTAGFSLDKTGSIEFFPYKTRVGEYNDSVLFYTTDYFKSSEIENNGRLNASTFFEKQTYGIGIDTESNLFFVQSEKEIRRYQFTIIKKTKGIWNARFQESRPIKLNVTDTFSINLGQKPFLLNIPVGFQPYIEEYNGFCKTINDKYLRLNYLQMYVFIVLL